MYIKCINNEGINSLSRDKIYYLLIADNMRLKVKCDTGAMRWFKCSRFMKVAHNSKLHANWRKEFIRHIN